jgi:hypothetical protein
MSVDRYLAKALASVVASIQLTDDEDLDPDVATSILEPVGAIFRDMTDDERQKLSELVRQCADSETNPNRRQIILDFPEAFGLLNGSS